MTCAVLTDGPFMERVEKAPMRFDDAVADNCENNEAPVMVEEDPKGTCMRRIVVPTGLVVSLAAGGVKPVTG